MFWEFADSEAAVHGTGQAFTSQILELRKTGGKTKPTTLIYETISPHTSPSNLLAHGSKWSKLCQRKGACVRGSKKGCIDALRCRKIPKWLINLPFVNLPDVENLSFVAASPRNSSRLGHFSANLHRQSGDQNTKIDRFVANSDTIDANQGQSTTNARHRRKPAVTKCAPLQQFPPRSLSPKLDTLRAWRR